MIGRSISIVPSFPADDQCDICVTQTYQLDCVLHQAWPPSGELLRSGFCCVSRLVRPTQLSRHREGCAINKHGVSNFGSFTVTFGALL